MRLIDPRFAQNRADGRTGGGTVGGVARQQPIQQIDQRRRDAVLNPFGPRRHGPKLDGAPHAFPFLRIQAFR